MWKLSIADDQANKTVVNLAREEYLIGRSEESAVRLTERNISRSHALLQRNGSAWLLVDKDSYNGCYVNGTRVSGTQELEHGDLVQLGDYRLELLDESAVTQPGDKAATLPQVPKSQSLLGQPDRLVMLVGPTPGLEIPLSSEPMIVGRGEECDIVINHSSVSRVHADIRPAGHGRYEVMDRESANAVRINGVELERGLIDARDNLELGDVVLKFIPAGMIYKPGAAESQQIDALAAAAAGLPDRATPAPGIEPMPNMKPGLPPAVKAILGVVLIGLLVVVGMFAFGGGGSDEDPETTTPAAVDKSATVLEEGRALLEKGKTEEAHQRVTSGIAADSNARKSATFKAIEAAWADMLFDQASEETDKEKKRALLDRIAKTTTVDSTRRKRAANEIQKLESGGDAIDVEELPNAGGTAKAPTSDIVRDNPFDQNEAGAAEEPKPAPTAAPAPTPAKKPSLAEMATSGDRKQMQQAKNILLGMGPGASTGQLRMLRGLCLQLGDSGCVAKASKWLADKSN